jgi:nitronate monooxygenase
VKIGKYEIKYPIIQGGMGVGISWDQLAGTVSLEGGLGVISSVGTGYYKNKSENIHIAAKNGKPKDVKNFYSKEILHEIFDNARKICGKLPLACNILYAINDYGRVLRDACEAGANIIITGAGLPTNMPEFTKDFPDVALVPIVSSARALKLICKKWERYNKIPDAIVVEGPLSGGHQGFKYEDCFKEEFQLENIVPEVMEEAKKWGDIPIIAAGGIWDKNDIDKFLAMGCAGVQMATRFIGTFECDADEKFKEIILNSKKEDIQLLKSPVGLPARGVRTNLQVSIENHTAPKINCVSNCVSPCHRGQEAKVVGYCIADRLGAAYKGDKETGLFFSGSNGYRLDKIISVKELMEKLVKGE